MLSQVWSRLKDDQFSAQARAVGIIAAQGAILESEIEMLFGVLLGTRYNQSKITYYAMLSLPPRLNIVRSLIDDNHSSDEALNTRWNDLRRKIDLVSGERNRCIHAIWADNPKTHALQRRTTHSNGIYEQRRLDMSVDDLTKVATDISEVAAEVNLFAQEMAARPPKPSPNK